MEIWRFIDSGDCSPAYNMALDEALLTWHSEGGIPPTLRFYSWNPATLSIGYFQNIEKDINLEVVKERKLGLVRRLTGGRAVLHDQELTYSVIVSEEKMPKTVIDAYRVISQGILEGFKLLGFDAYLSVPQTEQELERLKNPQSAVCFDASSWYELVVEGRKVVGSAQTRQKGVILQHGAILLDLDEDLLFSVFRYENEQKKERMQQEFRSKAVAINKLSNRQVTMEEAKSAFRHGFEHGLQIKLEQHILTEEENVYVQQLMKEKYEQDEWNYKR